MRELIEAVRAEPALTHAVTELAAVGALAESVRGALARIGPVLEIAKVRTKGTPLAAAVREYDRRLTAVGMEMDAAVKFAEWATGHLDEIGRMHEAATKMMEREPGQAAR